MADQEQFIPEEELANAAPWSTNGLLHRVGVLEGIALKYANECTHTNDAIKEIDTRLTHQEGVLKGMQETHSEVIATLKAMQTTLEMMQEVLISYNKAKSFLSVFGTFGNAVIFLGKLAVGAGIVLAAIKFGVLPTGAP